MNKKEFLLSLCRLYKGEKENPISKDDEFRWFIWRSERAIIERSDLPEVISEYDLHSEDSYEEYFKTQIRSFIDMFSDCPYGGSSDERYKIYFSLQ